MFDISWGKLVIIGVVALIVIGPKELPGVLRMVGQWMGKMRRMAAEFQGQFQDAMREAEMADLKKDFEETTSAVTSAFDTTSIKNDLDKMINDPLATDQTIATSTPATPPSDPAASVATDTTTPEATPPTDPVALGTGPAVPEPILDVPMPDLPPPVTQSDFAPAPSTETAATPNDAPKPAEGGKAA